MHRTAKAPSALLQWMELRAGAELAAGIAAYPAARLMPKGDGHAVLVLPGFLAGDGSTKLLRKTLCKLGYDARGWDQGRNLGPSPRLENAMAERLAKLAEESGGPVSLVGQSLGGMYARVLSQRHAEWVRMVATLGSPLAGHPRQTNAWRLYGWISGSRDVDEGLLAELALPAKVPTTAIYSKTDGVVAWPCSLVEAGEMSENIEVRSSHCGMGFHPAVLFALADRLAQPAGAWRPFERSGAKSWVYPEPASLGVGSGS